MKYALQNKNPPMPSDSYVSEPALSRWVSAEAFLKSPFEGVTAALSM